MKVLNSSYVNAFGGLNFVIEEFDRLNIGQVLDQELPQLPNQSKYNWRDICFSFWSVFFCGGDCSEDLAFNLRNSLSNIPGLKVPSPDRVLNRMKELSVPFTMGTARGAKRHKFGINQDINRLNIKLVKKILKTGKEPTVLDYDNTMLFTEKSDATMTYKKQFGYAPGVGIIGKNVVYVENRNGNSGAQTLQHNTLERMFTLLEDENINIDVFRADGASYQLSTISVIQNHVDKLYVRAAMSEQLYRAINQINNWKQLNIEGEAAARGSTVFVPFTSIAKRKKKEHLLKPYRLVVTKIKRRDGQVNLFSGEAFNYHAILTNDHEKTNDQVVHFYNQRGAIEKEFDVLKNDFGWNNMPFSKLEQNTVYLVMTAICRNLYQHIITTFSTKYNGLSPIFRIKKFIFRFICIPAKWIKTSRMWKLRLYGKLSFKT